MAACALFETSLETSFASFAACDSFASFVAQAA
jgi:hypothetical protein